MLLDEEESDLNSVPSSSATLQARRLLKIQYEARFPPRSPQFSWPSNQTLLSAQDFLDDDLFASPSKNVASEKYQRLVLRELCTRLEASVEEESEAMQLKGMAGIDFPEVSSLLLARYSELLASSSSGVGFTGMNVVPDEELTTQFWPTAQGELCQSVTGDVLEGLTGVTIREEGSAVSKGTTGLRTWEAGLRLAGHMVHHRNLVTSPDTRIVELGSGTGFLGSVCAKLSPQTPTWLTDVSRQVTDRIRDTLALNNLDGCPNIHVQELDWLELQAERQQNEQRDDLPTIRFLHAVQPTLVLAADLVYDPDLVGPLAETIRACLETSRVKHSQALVASTIRNPSTYDAFKAALESQSLSSEVIPLARPTFGSSGEGVLSIPIFPSAHDPGKDGVVELLRITLA